MVTDEFKKLMMDIVSQDAKIQKLITNNRQPSPGLLKSYFNSVNKLTDYYKKREHE